MIRCWPVEMLRCRPRCRGRDVGEDQEDMERVCER